MLPFQPENGKRKPGRFSLICLPFANYEKGSLSVCQKLSVFKRIKHTKRTCPSMVTVYIYISSFPILQNQVGKEECVETEVTAGSCLMRPLFC
jgi:hypothetical protein